MLDEPHSSKPLFRTLMLKAVPRLTQHALDLVPQSVKVRHLEVSWALTYSGSACPTELQDAVSTETETECV